MLRAAVEVDEGRSNGCRDIGVFPAAVGIERVEDVGGFIDVELCMAIGCIPVKPGGTCCGEVTCMGCWGIG